MTGYQELRELLGPLPGSGKSLVQVAHDILGLAARFGEVVLPGPGGRDDLAGLNPRLFRTLLAILSKTAADAAGAEFDPYHGRYTLTWAGGLGAPVRLAVAIENTQAAQRIQAVVVKPAEATRGRPDLDPAEGHRPAIA